MRKKYKFLRKDSGKRETVFPEIWQWEAHYQDGLVLKQFDDQGIFHQFKEIEQRNLAVFKMRSSHYPQAYSILFDPHTMELLHFYRNVVLNATTEFEKKVRIYCFGYEKRDGSKRSKVILAITPNHELQITDNIDQITL